MSIDVSTAVWERSRATGSARLVLLALADHASDDGRAWPSVSRLARMTLLDRRNVQRSLARLVEAGEIVVIGTGRRNVTVYEIRPGGASQPAAEAPQVEPTTCGGGAAGRDAQPAAEAPQRRRRRSGAGDARPAALVTRPAAVAPPEPSEPSLEPSEEAAAALQAAFDEFNRIASLFGLPEAKRLTARRREQLAARLAEAGGILGWLNALTRIIDTPGLIGGADSGWRGVDLDWLLDETNFSKVMEGRFENWGSGPTNGAGKKPTSGAERHRRVFAGLHAAAESVASRRRRGS